MDVVRRQLRGRRFEDIRSDQDVHGSVLPSEDGGAWWCGNRSPQRELGDCNAAYQLDKSQAERCGLSGVAWAEWHGARGGVRSQSPRARARGFYGSGGGVARVISPASQASERQDAEASLRGVSAGQDARSERPARWHGQPRPTRGPFPCYVGG